MDYNSRAIRRDTKHTHSVVPPPCENKTKKIENPGTNKTLCSEK